MHFPLVLQEGEFFMTTVAFYSSDYRPLYKSDIFRALALPKGHVIHFRYQKKYVDEQILSKLDSELLNSEGVIFYTLGTDPNNPQEDGVIENISIRKVKIVKACVKEDTGLVHFYLELIDFIDCKTPNDLEAPTMFVKYIEPILFDKDTWSNRIEKVKKSFQGALFFLIDSVKNLDGSNIKPEFKEIEGKSYYNLEDEKEYIIDLSFFDDSGGYNKLKLEIDKSHLISIDSPREIQVEAIRDNRSYSMVTSPLDILTSTAFLRFDSTFEEKDQPENVPKLELVLQINIKRQENKSFTFGAYSFFAFLALVVSNAAVRLSDLGTQTVFIVVGVASLVFAFATGALYHFFSKK